MDIKGKCKEVANDCSSMKILYINSSGASSGSTSDMKYLFNNCIYNATTQWRTNDKEYY